MIYDNIICDGEVVWKDFCCGLYLFNMCMVGNGWDFICIVVVYWWGSEKNLQLQCIYGIVWLIKDELCVYQECIVEVECCDYCKFGVEMDLFLFLDEIGLGLVVFYFKGGIICYEIEENLCKYLLCNGYDFVNSLYIMKKDFFMMLGYLQIYVDGMFLLMYFDEIVDDEGNIICQGQDYYLKLMNCLFYNFIFCLCGCFYWELLLWLVEFGMVYCYEKFGMFFGLICVCGLIQDDVYIYVVQDQVKEEFIINLNFVFDLFCDYGFNDFYFEFLMNEEGNLKFFGEFEQWLMVIDILCEVVIEFGFEFVVDLGGVVFYGLKILVQVCDVIGWIWQMLIIQLDFNQFDCFELEYIGFDGQKY